MTNVFLTGGAGFIGSHVAERLMAQGHQVAILDNLSRGERSWIPPKAVLYEGDLRDKRFVTAVVAEVQPQVVIHAAAQTSVARSLEHPEEDLEINALGTLHLLEASRKAGVRRFVYLSSGGALYPGGPEPAREEDRLLPSTPYGISKLAGELYVRQASFEHGIEAVALRLANIYGPRQKEPAVVPSFCRRLLQKEPCLLHGDGRAYRDFVYVEDAVEAILLAVERDLPGEEPFVAFNVASSTRTDVLTLFRKLKDLLDPHASPAFLPLPRGIQEGSLLDASRIREAWGWQARTSLEEGLRRTAQYWRNALS